MLIKTLFVSLLLHATPTFCEAAESSCLACHAPKTEDRTCVRCHVSSINPQKSRNHQNLYANAPIFDRKILSQNRAFDPKGLALYLENPPLRRRHHGGMFPMLGINAQKIMRTLVSWTEESTFQANENLSDKGKKLFMEQGCEACHGENGKAPRLPIGRQLYNFQYFAMIVKGGATYYGSTRSREAMPKYESLSQTDLEALFSYISLVQVENIQEVSDSTLINPQIPHLTQATEGVFRRNGCLHCHSSSDTARTEIRWLFGGRPDGFQLSEASQGLRIEGTALQREASGTNRLLTVLTERKAEWHQKGESTIRGMPLGLPPISDGDLQIIKYWVKAGCPTQKQYICERF